MDISILHTECMFSSYSELYALTYSDLQVYIRKSDNNNPYLSIFDLSTPLVNGAVTALGAQTHVSVSAKMPCTQHMTIQMPTTCTQYITVPLNHTKILGWYQL